MCDVIYKRVDGPIVDAVIIARSTKTTRLYTQCVGHSLRNHPGKEDCLILNFTDKHHVLDNVVTLECTIHEAVHVEDVIEKGEVIEGIDNRSKL